MKGRKPRSIFIVVSALFATVLLCAAILLQLAYLYPSSQYSRAVNKVAVLIEAPDEIDAVIGIDTFQLDVDSGDEIVSYTSDNPDVASVDENGVVTVKSEGSAVITTFTAGDLLKTPAFSKTVVNVHKLKAPEIICSKPGVRDTEIEWGKVDYADGYYVNEYDSSDKLIDTVRLSAEETYTEFSDKTIGDTYSYEVVAFSEVGDQEFMGEPSEKVTETVRDAIMGQACNDENKRTRGGVAGDQTGKEVTIGKWRYGSAGWNHWGYVARFKDPEKARIAADAMEAACANDHIGYDQSNRTNLYEVAKAADWDIASITEDCECSCSPLISVCINCAGVEVPAGWTTSNKSMRSYMEATGEFEFFTDSSYTASTSKLKRGDILVTPGRHAGMVL